MYKSGHECRANDSGLVNSRVCFPLLSFEELSRHIRGVFAVSVFRIPTHLHKSACFVNWGDRLVCMEPHKASFFGGGAIFKAALGRSNRGGISSADPQTWWGGLPQLAQPIRTVIWDAQRLQSQNEAAEPSCVAGLYSHFFLFLRLWPQSNSAFITWLQGCECFHGQAVFF